MKTPLLLLIVIFTIHVTNAQTKLINPKTILNDKIKSWDVLSNGNMVAKAYTIEKFGFVEITHFTSIVEGIKMAATYTSADGSIAGKASINCSRVGNEDDPFRWRANSYLNANDGKLSFSKRDIIPCTGVQVYQIISQNFVFDDLVNRLTKTKFKWRFLVQKEWWRDTSFGSDWMVVDFTTPMELAKATKIISELKRTKSYKNNFNSSISACLLDTGIFYPFLINGIEIHGKWKKPSNVLIIR